MDHAKLLDVLTSLPVSHAILPRAVCFATSRQANNAMCSYIDSSGYASRRIRNFLFIDYIIIADISFNGFFDVTFQTGLRIDYNAINFHNIIFVIIGDNCFNFFRKCSL